MRARRHSLDNLSVGERRVLEAFYRGQLSAGQLSTALARARRRPAVQPVAVAPVATQADAAPQLQLVA